MLVQDFWGRREAVLSVAITTLSFGTIYLARSLYGEVPALMFLVWSMVCWGRSFHSDRGNALAVASGVLWGLGILAKSFLFLSVFPIIGVWLYDRLTTKQISAKQILLPGVGGLSVLGTWYVTTAYYSYLVTEEISMVFLYRHYLMFGLPSSRNGFEWFANQPVYSASLLVIVLYAIPQLFERIQNPALRVSLLSSELYLFWWIFYTPASIFRYMWYSCAIVGIFSGPMILRGYRAVRDSASPPRQRIVFLLAGVSVLIPCGYRLVEQLGLIYMQDEAADERDLAEYLRSLPEDVFIASAYWPIGMSMDFMAQRNIHGIADLSDIDDKYDVIIYNVDFDPVNAETLEGAHRIGRYAVIRTDRTKGTTYFDRQRN